ARGRGAPRPLPTDALPSGTPDPGGGRQGAPDEEGRGMSVPRSHGSPEPWGYGAPEPGTHGAPEPGAYGSPASQARPSPDPTLHSAPTGAAAHHLPEPRLAPPAPAVPAPTPAPGPDPATAHPAAAPGDRPAPPAPVPLALDPPRSRGRIGRLHVGQIVVLQLAAAAALTTYPQPDAVFLPVLGVCLAVAGATLAPSGRRWWYEDVARRWALRVRHRRRPPAGGDPRLAALAPGLAVEEITDRGLRIGIGMDGDGWYAALSVGDPAGGPARPDRLVQVLTRVSAPVSALQVVHHTVPVPMAVSPAGEHTWVGLRLAAADAPAESASRGGGVEGAQRAVTAAVGRVGRTLRASGLTTPALAARGRRSVASAVRCAPAASPRTC